jgi:hypothetical protein
MNEQIGLSPVTIDGRIVLAVPQPSQCLRTFLEHWVSRKAATPVIAAPARYGLTGSQCIPA